MEEPRPYRGRFAPSPSGLLHFGSVVAAMASYLDARARQGAWLLRIEDVDRTRTIPGAADRIRRDLERLGMQWDEEAPAQSRRTGRYRELIADLLATGDAFACNCSRADIRRVGRAGRTGPVYPGTCRSRSLRPAEARSIRLQVPDESIGFDDRWSGPFAQRLERDVGDFVIRRADGYVAYHLAVVADDQDQGITDVVRGRDLLESTPRQIWLQRVLGFDTPCYGHVPLVVDALGRKLSKRTRSDPAASGRPIETLAAAFVFLGGNSAHAAPETVSEFWPWAIERWSAALSDDRAGTTCHAPFNDS